MLAINTEPALSGPIQSKPAQKWMIMNFINNAKTLLDILKQRIHTHTQSTVKT